MIGDARLRPRRAPGSSWSRSAGRSDLEREARGVVDIRIPGQAAIDRLPQQVGQRQLDILAPARIAQVSFYEHAQAQTLIQLAHQNQTTVGGHPGALEVDLQRAIEGELKGPVLCFTHRLSTSAPLRPHPNPRPPARFAYFTKLLVH